MRRIVSCIVLVLLLVGTEIEGAKIFRKRK